MRLLLITLFICCFTPLLNAGSTQLGKKLHQENCIACHAAMTGGDGSVLYTRKDHQVASMDSLVKQIHQCQSSLGLNWSAEKKHSVQKYLNESFYNY